jgi:hypothetical protein
MKLDAADVSLPDIEQSLQAHIPPPVGQFVNKHDASALDMLRALLFLSQGRSPSTTALRLELPSEFVDQLAHDAQAIHDKLVNGDEARLRKHSDAPRSRRLAPRGLLSLIHVRAHERLRAGLASITSRRPTSAAGLDQVSPSELVAMVGGRRQISMWESNHFRLAAFVARLMIKDRSRLRLEVPARLTAKAALSHLENLAGESGWLPMPSATTTLGAPLCSGWAPVRALPRVALEGGKFDVQQRVSLRVTSGERDGEESPNGDERIADGIEFVIAVVCANAFARWNSNRIGNLA